MNPIIDVLMPKTPDCWETCGNCGSGDISIDEILVKLGDIVEQDEPLVVLETGKVALDIPAPCAGKVVEICVAVGESIVPRQKILRIEPTS